MDRTINPIILNIYCQGSCFSSFEFFFFLSKTLNEAVHVLTKYYARLGMSFYWAVIFYIGFEVVCLQLKCRSILLVVFFSNNPLPRPTCMHKEVLWQPMWSRVYWIIFHPVSYYAQSSEVLMNFLLLVCAQNQAKSLFCSRKKGFFVNTLVFGRGIWCCFLFTELKSEVFVDHLKTSVLSSWDYLFLDMNQKVSNLCKGNRCVPKCLDYW